MNPTDPALAAAVAALTQQITGLGTAVTLLANQQNHQQARKPGGPPTDQTRPGAPSAPAGEAPLVKSLTLAAAKIMAFLAPIVAVSNVLSQTISGLGVFTAAIKLLGATIAPLVMPVFLILAAAIVAVSDELWDGIKNVLPLWYRFILDNVVPVFVSLVQAVRDVIDWFRRLSATLPGAPKPPDAPGTPGTSPGRPVGPADPVLTPEQRRSRQRMLEDDSYRPEGWNVMNENARGEWFMERDRIRRAEAMNWLRLRNQARARGEQAPDKAAPHLQRVLDADPTIAEEARRDPYGKFADGSSRDPSQRPLPAPGDVGRQPGGGGSSPVLPPLPGAGGAGGRPSVEQRFNTALRDVVQSLRQSIGPPAQILNTASVNQQAQKDALQMDPLERRMQQRMFEALEIFIKEMPQVRQNTAPQPAGLFPGN